MLHQCRKARCVFGGVTGMSNLDAVHTLLDEGGNSILRSRMRRMREHGQSARAMNQRRRLRDDESLFGDIRWTSVPEIAIEGVAKIHGPSFSDHRPRHVRAT